jgi:hypothetical protein
VVGLRDRAVIGKMTYTLPRIAVESSVILTRRQTNLPLSKHWPSAAVWLWGRDTELGGRILSHRPHDQGVR